MWRSLILLALLAPIQVLAQVNAGHCTPRDPYNTSPGACAQQPVPAPAPAEQARPIWWDWTASQLADALKWCNTGSDPQCARLIAVAEACKQADSMADGAAKWCRRAGFAPSNPFLEAIVEVPAILEDMQACSGVLGAFSGLRVGGEVRLPKGVSVAAEEKAEQAFYKLRKISEYAAQRWPRNPFSRVTIEHIQGMREANHLWKETYERGISKPEAIINETNRYLALFQGMTVKGVFLQFGGVGQPSLIECLRDGKTKDGADYTSSFNTCIAARQTSENVERDTASLRRIIEFFEGTDTIKCMRHSDALFKRFGLR